MAKVFALLVVAALCVSMVMGHGDHGHDHSGDGSHVLVLTDDNFDGAVAANDYMLVEFYAPWCGHCKKLAPEYEEAAHNLDGKVKLAKVDCTEQRDLCEKYDVKGFPTLKIFRTDGSAPMEYNAGRTADLITKFMEKQLAPAFIEAKSEAEVKAQLGSEVVVVGFFASKEAAGVDAFIKTAKSLRNDYTFVLVTENAAAVAPAFDAEVPDVVVFKPFNEPPAEYEGEYQYEPLAVFIKNEAFPLVGEIGPENYQKYLERALPLVWFFVDKAAAATTQLLADAATLAGEAKGSVSFVYLDGIRWADHAKSFGLSGNTPGIVIEDREDSKNYVFKLEPTIENLRAHVNGYLDGSLAPTVKSQEIPTDNSGPVKVVVGKTFDQIVLDDSKDVFVEFYAPWCGHCKSLAPRYEKLGELFAKEPSVVIAKIDATENDTPAKIQGFPTLLFYPAGAKQNPIQFNGDRTEDAMSEFIYKNGNTLKGKASKAAKSASADHDDL